MTMQQKCVYIQENIYILVNHNHQIIRVFLF